MLNKIILAKTLFIILLIVLPLIGQTKISHNGMEMANYKRLGLSIDKVDGYSKFIDISEERIEIKCKLKISQAGLTLVDLRESEAALRVKISVEGFAYHVQLDFYRPLKYEVKKRGQFEVSGITWTKGITGTHEESAGIIMLSLDELLDKFLKEYLNTNQ